MPWLDAYAGTLGTPVTVTYTIHWPDTLTPPDTVPAMQTGDILVTAKNGLPAMRGHVSVRTLYQQATALDPTKSSTQVIDFQRARPCISSGAGECENCYTPPIVINPLPPDVQTQIEQGVTYFPQLSPSLKPRVTYNGVNGELGFAGFFVAPPLGDYYVFLNVMTAADKTELLGLSNDPAGTWAPAINNLYSASSSILTVPDDCTDFEPNGLALTTGAATGGGYVTLAFENTTNPKYASLPVSLSIIKVLPALKPGEIAVISPDCPFDERLDLMHKGDFDGEPGITSSSGGPRPIPAPATPLVGHRH